MDHFQYAGDALHAEQVPLAEIAARAGTPCYVYSRATIERHWRAFDEAFGGHPHRICYAVKANGNLAVLNLLARLGSGFDIVSGGELRRVIAAGGIRAKRFSPASANRTGKFAKRSRPASPASTLNRKARPGA